MDIFRCPSLGKVASGIENNPVNQKDEDIMSAQKLTRKDLLRHEHSK